MKRIASLMVLMVLVALTASAEQIMKKSISKGGSKDGSSLTGPERRAMQAAADALAAKGPEGIAELAKQIRAGKDDEKVAALLALRNLGPEAAPALESATAVVRTDEKLRSLAISVLKAMGPKAKASVPALIDASKHTEDFDGSFAKGGSSNTAEAALEAVEAIDPASLPKVAEAMIPGLVEVVRQGKGASSANALALLRQLGSHAQPALPKLKAQIPKMSPDTLRGVLPVFLASGEEGMAILADYLIDPSTSSAIKLGLMEGYRWERRSTPSSLRMLRALLKDKTSSVRVAALQTLRSVQAKELIPDLVELLADAEVLKVGAEFRGDDPFHVAHALGNQGKDAVPALVKALDHKTALARYQAAHALASIGKDAKPAAATLEKLFDDAQPLVAIKAAEAVLISGDSDKAQAKLKKHLVAGSELLVPTLEALQHLGPRARPLFPTLKELVLKSNDEEVQRLGFRTLEQMQGDPKEVVDVWAKLVAKNSWFLNFPPKDQIRAHAKEAEPVLPLLLKFLKDPDVNTRRRATEALAAMGPAAAKAMPELIKALDDDSFVAHGAMEALGAMGSAGQPAVAPLVRAFDRIKEGNDKEGDYRRQEILRALEEIGPAAREAVPRLVVWLPDNPRAARVLGKIGPDSKQAVPALEKLHAGDTGYPRIWAAFALVKITGKTEPYVPQLAEMFQRSRDTYQRGEAIEALAELGPDARAALPVFLLALKDKEADHSSRYDLRHLAARALVHFGPAAKDAVPDLIDMVKKSYYMAKIAAADALGAIGPDAKEAIPALLEMAEEDPRFQPVVGRALAKIRGK